MMKCAKSQNRSRYRLFHLHQRIGMLRAFCFEFSPSHKTGFEPTALWSRLYLAEVSKQNTRNVANHTAEKACIIKRF